MWIWPSSIFYHFRWKWRWRKISVWLAGFLVMFLSRSKAEFVTCELRIWVRFSNHYSRDIRGKFKGRSSRCSGIFLKFLLTCKRWSGRNPRDLGKKSWCLWISLALKSLQDTYGLHAEGWVTNNFLFKDSKVFNVDLKQVMLGELQEEPLQRAMSQSGSGHIIQDPEREKSLNADNRGKPPNLSSSTNLNSLVNRGLSSGALGFIFGFSTLF